VKFLILCNLLEIPTARFTPNGRPVDPASCPLISKM
jgi:hypothetical protein